MSYPASVDADNNGRMAIFAKGLAISSFLIYATLIFVVPQIRDGRYCCEQSSFSAAISNIVYGSRIGAMYTGVFDIFIKHFTEPLPQALDEIRAELPTEPSGILSPTTLDGNGVGYPVVATAAFRIFGFRWWAPAAVMLILMAASTVIFLRRFPPLLVTLYFSCLTVMLFSWLVWEPAARGQIPVAGIRYFSLVGELPLFYILLSLIQRRPFPDTKAVAAQAAILMVSALARGNAITAFGAIAVVGLVFSRARRNIAVVRDLKTVILSSVVVVIIFALAVSPQYLTSGRFQTIVWTRVLQGLGINPKLPISELNEMFPCQKYIPGGIPPGIDDQGSQCIWFAYVIEHNIPIESLWNKSYGGEFDSAMRSAFFRIVARYPRETLDTLISLKPRITIGSVAMTLQFKLSDYPPMAIALLVISLGLALAAAATSARFVREAIVVSVSTLFTATAYLAAYANPWVTSDLTLYCLILSGLATCATIGGVVGLVRHRKMECADGG